MSSPKISKTERTERLLEAATQNDLETLKPFLDSPEWYNIRDEDDHSLLEIAILEESNEVFDYLLSLSDFPLDAVNNEGFTALENLVFNHSENEWYAVELIKKGANIDKKRKGWSLLHRAVEHGKPRIVLSLIERGADVNYYRINEFISSPLLDCVNNYCGYGDEEIDTELITMLLCNGADPLFCDSLSNYTPFDNLCCIWEELPWILKRKMLVALENLFYFTVDQWSSLRIATLLNLAQSKSPLLQQVIKFKPEIISINPDLISEYCLDVIFTFDSDYLGILLENYPDVIKECLQSYSEDVGFIELDYGYPEELDSVYMRAMSLNETFHLENLEMLLQSALRSDTLELISKLNSRRVVPIILRSGKNTNETFELIYYLLSYGMVLKQRDLQDIYEITGYSKDFKNFLFMDIEIQNDERFTLMMPRLIYDVTLDIHKIVENVSLCDFIDWEQIFHYFIHPKIQNAYRQLKPDEAAGRRLPQVPLLKELARDAFRKYFLKTFKITTSKQFYTLIKRLNIGRVYEKIVTYETKLY